VAGDEGLRRRGEVPGLPDGVSPLERALALALRAHAGQRKRDTDPFILHDVVEKSDWTLEGLRAQGFSDPVVRAVDALTKREGESYETLVERAASNPLARDVKRADLADNIVRARAALRSAPESSEARARLERYERARARLTWGP